MSKEYVKVLPIGTVIKINDNHYFKIVEVLGQGGFGITYKVIDEKKNVLALKEHFVKNICSRRDDGVGMSFEDTAAREVKDSLKEFRREGRLLKDISDQCPNIVNVYEVFEANGTAYYSMEYLGGGSLRNLVRKKGALNEAKAKAIIMPIAEALTYLHSRKILHMDIKPDNIVMRVNPHDGTPMPVLIDFGVSLHFDAKNKLTTTHHIAGVTRGFSPIEQYDPIKKFSPTVDIYALAATWFYLLVGHNPIAATEIVNNQNWIQQNLPASVSDATRNAIVKGMKYKHNERPKSVKDFISLMDENATIDITELIRRRKAHLKRIAIAACIVAAMAIGVLLFADGFGGKEEQGGSPPPTSPPPPPMEAKHYKLSGKLTNRSGAVEVNLYLTAIEDSASGICYQEGKDSAFIVEGNIETNMIVKNVNGDSIGTFYKNSNIKNSYAGHYFSKKSEAYFGFNMKLEEIDSTEIPEMPIAESTFPQVSKKNVVVDKKKDKQTNDNPPTADESVDSIKTNGDNPSNDNPPMTDENPLQPTDENPLPQIDNDPLPTKVDLD